MTGTDRIIEVLDLIEEDIIDIMATANSAGYSSMEVLEALELIEPHRVCRRLQLLREWSHYEQDNEQVFT